MAIEFDEIDDYFTITDSADLTLPDGDWCVGIWTKVDDNTGVLYQYLLSNNNYSVNNSFNLHLWEDNVPGVSDDNWQNVVEDGDGTTVTPVSVSNPNADSVWRLVITQRDTGSSEIQIYFCEFGQAAVKAASESDAGFDAVNGGDWDIGRRVDGDAGRYYGNTACEFFLLPNDALTAAEITALGAGLPPKTFAKKAGITLNAYLPMWLSEATLLDYSNNGNSAARSSAPTTVDHAPICTPVKRRRIS